VYISLPALVGVTDCMPLVAIAPLQAPLAVQEVAPIDDHVSVALWSRVTELLLSARLTVGAALAAPPPLPPPQAQSTRETGSASAPRARMWRVDVQMRLRMGRNLEGCASSNWGWERPRVQPVSTGKYPAERPWFTPSEDPSNKDGRNAETTVLQIYI
jgi:hypothetical protein